MFYLEQQIQNREDNSYLIIIISSYFYTNLQLVTRSSICTSDPIVQYQILKIQILHVRNIVTNELSNNVLNVPQQIPVPYRLRSLLPCILFYSGQSSQTSKKKARIFLRQNYYWSATNSQFLYKSAPVILLIHIYYYQYMQLIQL